MVVMPTYTFCLEHPVYQRHNHHVSITGADSCNFQVCVNIGNMGRCLNGQHQKHCSSFYVDFDVYPVNTSVLIGTPCHEAGAVVQR